MQRIDPSDDDPEVEASGNDREIEDEDFASENEGWICAKIVGLSKCLSGIDTKKKSKGLPYYYCWECFENKICEKCVKLDIFISQNDFSRP